MYEKKKLKFSLVCPTWNSNLKLTILAVKGHLKCNVLKSSTVSETYVKKADINQLQIEQDSGKSLHDEIGNVTLVDLNRCGQGKGDFIM